MFFLTWIARLFYSKEEIERMDQVDIVKRPPKRKRVRKRNR
jgi:hypothetical protein